MTVLRAIRLKCLDCMADDKKGIKQCPFPDCPLFPFRLGTNPNRKGIGNTKGIIKINSERKNNVSSRSF